MFSYEFYKIFKNTLFTEHLRTTASEIVIENSPENSVRSEKLYVSIFYK